MLKNQRPWDPFGKSTVERVYYRAAATYGRRYLFILQVFRIHTLYTCLSIFFLSNKCPRNLKKRHHLLLMKLQMPPDDLIQYGSFSVIILKILYWRFHYSYNFKHCRFLTNSWQEQKATLLLYSVQLKFLVIIDFLYKNAMEMKILNFFGSKKSSKTRRKLYKIVKKIVPLLNPKKCKLFLKSL